MGGNYFPPIYCGAPPGTLVQTGEDLILARVLQLEFLILI